jgi:hypothetical protein
MRKEFRNTHLVVKGCKLYSNLQAGGPYIQGVTASSQPPISDGHIHYPQPEDGS